MTVEDRPIGAPVRASHHRTVASCLEVARIGGSGHPLLGPERERRLTLQDSSGSGGILQVKRLAPVQARGFPSDPEESILWALRPTRGRMKIAAAERSGAAAILLFAPLAYFHPSYAFPAGGLGER
ncbi:MAG: hypothetical protein ACRD0K_15475 [Egibacteraceae bacterium]